MLLLILLASAAPAFGRGGGGCFEEGTPILTPTGEVPIEQLRVGDVVIGGRVAAITRVEPIEYLEVAPGIHVTAEHPFQIAPGVFCTAERVFPTARRVEAHRPAYNLLISPGGTFVAAGFVVHNKGCFLPDTPILRADGTRVVISAVRVGDKLLAFDESRAIVTATVRNVITHDVDEYLIVRTDQIELRVTAEHPFYVGDGTFKTLEALNVGDTIFAYDGGDVAAGFRSPSTVSPVVAPLPHTTAASRPTRLTGASSPRRLSRVSETPSADGNPAATGGQLTAQHITSIERVLERTRVYNLQTDAPNTFFANGIAVHNKGGGCFPAGTLILTPHGAVPIGGLVPGDVVSTGQGGTAVVEATFITRAPVLTVETDAGTLRTTAEHPLLCADGRFRLAGGLSQGDRLYGATVLRCVRGEESLVYNLRVGGPHTFVADGFVVHNKGGGGFGGGGFHGGGYHGGGGSDDPRVILLFVGIVVVVLVSKAVAAKREADENLDFCYSRAVINLKANKTRKLLEFIAHVNPEFTPQALQQKTTSVFVKLQECWQAREYGPMQELMMPDLYAEHCAQLQGLRRNHEINVIDGLKVESVDIVNVRYTHKENEREFTALITATARDYYTDDQDGDFLRGDETAARFQEFWTFHWQDGKWLLREIEQTRESDALKEENFFEPFTDKTRDQIYAEAVGGEGEAGPWLEKTVETKATRIERLLNFLVQTDKLWNRQAMLERAREVFTRVMLAREAGDVTAVSDADLFPAVATDLRQEITRQRNQGNSIEFRNLCIRKAELILVRNFADNSKDEYTVRISAHAQRILKRSGAVVHQDEYVTPFMEYWTFGRLDGQWKLKEVLPPSRGEEELREENVDQDSSAAQLQWYYRQTRAN